MNEIKITFVGDSGTGKTSILRAFDGYDYEENCELRMCDTFSKYMVVNNSSYMLVLRDTIGSENFESGRADLYKDTDIFFICFAEDNPISFKNVLVKWYPEIKKVKPMTPIFLIRTKYDIKSKQILQQEVLDVRKKIRAAQVVCCSAKAGSNIKEMFKQAILNIFECSSPKPTLNLPNFFTRSNSAS